MRIINYTIIAICVVEIVAGIIILTSGELDAPAFLGVFLLNIICATVIGGIVEVERERRELLKDIDWCENSLAEMKRDIEQLKKR